MVKSEIDDITTYSPNAAYQVKPDGSNTNTRKYYSFNGAVVAMRENGVLTWMLQDQVNSTTITADANGNLLSETRYSAFEEIRFTNGAAVTDKLYTGQQQEVEIGLMYYVARFYDPVIAHFIQPDSIIPQASASESYDRYAYVNGNPINFNDPSGHAIKIDDGGSCVGYWECLRNIPIIQSKPKVTIPTGFFPNNPIISTQWTKETIIPVTPTPKPPLVQIGPVEGNSTNSISQSKEPWKLPYKLVIDKDEVDWVDFGIDVVGIAGDGLTLIPGIGMIPEYIATFTELSSLAKSGSDFISENDLSGLSLDMAGKYAQEFQRQHPGDTGRPVPWIGLVFNVISLYKNFEGNIHIEER